MCLRNLINGVGCQPGNIGGPLGGMPRIMKIHIFRILVGSQAERAKKGLFQSESVTKRTIKAAGRKTRTRASSLARDRLSVALHTASSNHFGTISGQGDGGREGEREEGRSNAQDRKTECLPSIWRARWTHSFNFPPRARVRRL